jgi:hypothetical protein
MAFMQSKEQTSTLQNVTLELERKFPYFKKMDVHAAVREAYKKSHSLIRNISEREIEEIKDSAMHDLNHS